MLEPEKMRSAEGVDERRARAVVMWEVKVGVSLAWKGARSHSDSEVPWVGPPR